MMENRIVIASVVRDKAMYEKCIAGNSNVADCELVSFDNVNDNIPIPIRYNSFLNSFDFSRPAWLVFCHEDLEPLVPVKKVLSGLSVDSLWGPIGARKRPVIPFLFYRWGMAGRIRETDKSGKVTRMAGVARPRFGIEVDTFDCCCLMVYSSVVQKHGLRFDENLPWDLYAEDFCISAHKHGVPSRTCDLPAVHHSLHDSLPDSYVRAKSYLEGKYPDDCFAGTSSWIGGNVFSRHFGIGVQWKG